MLLTIYIFAVKNVLVNQWDDIANISCPAQAQRCFHNGTDVINFMSVYPVRYKKKSSESLENILKVFF